MPEEAYISPFGWQWSLPAGFTCYQMHTADNAFGTAQATVFRCSDHIAASLSWAVLNGPVDYFTDARFKSIIADQEPVNINRLQDILLSILPAAGTIEEAKVVKLADQADAIEMIQSGPVKHGGTRTMLYVLLFPVEPPATDRGADFNHNSVIPYTDPVTNQLLILSPVFLGERLNPETFEVTRVYQVGHDRYQRIIFSSSEPSFSKLLPSIKRSSRGFHYKVRKRAPAEIWQDAADLLHEELTKSFEVLTRPPQGLRDEDLKHRS